MKVFILISVIASLVCINTSLAAVITVGKGKDVATIHQAIDKANNGDTVLVYPGEYHEKNILINKSIALIGIDRPVIDGDHAYEMISVAASNVVVKGFRVQHSGKSSLNDIAAIKIYSSSYVTIENNIVDDSFFGIFANNASSCTIRNNYLTAYNKGEQESGNGIHCWKSDSMHIQNNTATGFRDGIYFEFVTHSIISRNLSEKNIRYGLHFMFSHNDTYVSNTFRNNGAGVAVMFTHGVKMINNVFENNWGAASYGLLLKEISDSYIQDNRFLENTMGIYMEGTSRIALVKNLFKKNGYAMKIMASCADNKLYLNNFLGNSFDVGTNGSISLNEFKNNYWDKYEGYDLNRDGIGDVPYRPISLYSMIVEQNPPAMMLFRSFIVTLLDKTEKVIPAIIPENLKDNYPSMKQLSL
ncbi:nitrous oxide reductase family maturation protein NosD [Ilyomonas limi]|uniref:Nitrous oxide reductase family maturation protein NosD n=1 Tax=Ilyomonas limi TaxID=2575867 RepID=A0A4U3L0G2_9BACT|nr:nitrous oxide reductase family maturation protein NosD [Ilyomonas limi]TKK68581.1 nitrous oxide reductase family maturation protein NosD [Ilyomonas limi]